MLLHDPTLPVERFSALTEIAGIAHCFTTRVPGVEVKHDEPEALRRLDGVHGEIRANIGVGQLPLATAQQVHGSALHVLPAHMQNDACFDGCDGLTTNQRGVCLGIYVADCCVVYLVDPIRGAIALVHSGKKGTELGIVANAIDRMDAEFGSAARDLVVQLSPCIRPPHYEIDFAAEIVRTCRDHGVIRVHDSGVCTACHLGRYYSYRAEKGRTGRMLALLALTP